MIQYQRPTNRSVGPKPARSVSHHGVPGGAFAVTTTPFCCSSVSSAFVSAKSGTRVEKAAQLYPDDAAAYAYGCYALHNLGMSYARLGNIEEGIACERQASRIADECQVARLRISARIYEAIFLVWRGAPGDYGTAHALARWLCDETVQHAAGWQAMASFTLARVQLAGSFDDYYVGLPLFGLAATICAWLWFKSNYIPRGLAMFGVIASAWCVFCAFVYLIFPHFNKIVNDWWFDFPMALFELIVSVWLLTKGLKPTAPIRSQAGTP